MISRKLVATLALTIAGVSTLTALSGGGWSVRPSVEKTDFALTRRTVDPVYDARLLPASVAPIKEFTIPITDTGLEIASGVRYDGWTFGGTVPGPVMRVREGDLVRVKVVNQTPMPHSIDFHSARVPANEAYRMILPRDSVLFEFTARDPGAYMVHCGTPPVMMHLMQGMYLTMIVDPKDGWGTKADKEFVLVQSEFYGVRDSANTSMRPDYAAAQAKQAGYVVFNGRAFQYKDSPLTVDVGDRVRFFVVNAGPNFSSDFHVVGAIFDRVYPDGNPDHALEGVQTYGIPAGGGVVFETVFAEGGSGEGIYPFVTHSFADAEKGAVGLIRVGTPTRFTAMNH